MDWCYSIDTRLNNLSFLPFFPLLQKIEPTTDFQDIRFLQKNGYSITDVIAKIKCIVQISVNTEAYFGSTVLISFSSWSAARDCGEKKEVKKHVGRCMCLRLSPPSAVTIQKSQQYLYKNLYRWEEKQRGTRTKNNPPNKLPRERYTTLF